MSVVLEGLRKVFDGETVAVANANLTVEEGEFLVLVGPSGCGKSTTLRMIAGLETVTEGSIYINGQRVNDVPPKDRNIAMVFQNYALYPHMSVFDNMAFGLKMRRVPKPQIRERVGEAAATLGLQEILGRKPGQLSGGQRQRVALGRAIVRDPLVFLFDEPLSNLDAKLRVQMRMEISRLHRQLGATMIYVTHDQVEAMTMGDRIVVMRDGIIEQIDKPLNLYHRPANLFVADFIGSPSMNFLQGRLSVTDRISFRASKVEFASELNSVPENTEVVDGQDVTIGFRPDCMRILTDSSLEDGWTPVSATVELVEPMGSDVVLYTLVGDQSIVAKVVPQVLPHAGQDVQLLLDTSQIHVFDTLSGARLN